MHNNITWIKELVGWLMANEFPFDIAWRSDTLTKLVVLYIGHAADQHDYYYHGIMICGI